MFSKILNAKVTKCVLQKCQKYQICRYYMFFLALNAPKLVLRPIPSPYPPRRLDIASILRLRPSKIAGYVYATN